LSRLGPCSPTPSGPAAAVRLHQQAGQKTAPDQHVKASNQLLQCGSHPQKTFAVVSPGARKGPFENINGRRRFAVDNAPVLKPLARGWRQEAIHRAILIEARPSLAVSYRHVEPKAAYLRLLGIQYTFGQHAIGMKLDRMHHRTGTPLGCQSMWRFGLAIARSVSMQRFDTRPGSPVSSHSITVCSSLAPDDGRKVVTLGIGHTGYHHPTEAMQHLAHGSRPDLAE
jgi:hypothetical protein